MENCKDKQRKKNKRQRNSQYYIVGSSNLFRAVKKEDKKRHPQTITEALLLSKCTNELLLHLKEVDFNL
jgi:hypothetical protein